MKGQGYKCFFITPIGKEGSPERDNADRVLHTLLKPALATCGFAEESIIRSDLSVQPGTISLQLESHLSDADLCIADLTGANPNVMYELGFRKGLDKPVVIIATKGADPLPFDVQGERIIPYDFNGGWRAEVEVREKIRQQVMLFMERGQLDEKKLKVKDVYDRLNAIEQKLEKVLSKAVVDTGAADGDAEMGELIEKFGGVARAFAYCLEQKDIANGEKLLARLAQSADKKALIIASATLAGIGSLTAGLRFKNLYAEWKENLDFEDRIKCLSNYINCCNILDMEPEEIEYVKSELMNLESGASTDSERSRIFNQKNRICYGAYMTCKSRGEVKPEYLKETIVALQRAIELDPTEASYHYNYALVLVADEKYQKAKAEIVQCLTPGTKDYDHLVLAYKIFVRVGDTDEMNKMDRQLTAMNRQRWQFDKRRLDD